MNRQIIIILFLIPFKLIAQIDYDEIKRKSFYSAEIDTIKEKILIVEMNHAIVIFKQLDIGSIIKNTGNSADNGSFRYFAKYNNI